MDGVIDEHLTIVAAWAAKYDSQEQLIKAVPYFRIKMAFAQEQADQKALVTWCFQSVSTPEEQALTTIMEHQGGVRKLGPAPRSGMERRLQTFLETT